MNSAYLSCQGARLSWDCSGTGSQSSTVQLPMCGFFFLGKPSALCGVIRGKGVRTTIQDRNVPCPLDRVQRQFRADRPNALWVSDFTFVSTWQGFVYVAFVVDVYARRIVGWEGDWRQTTQDATRLKGRLFDSGPDRRSESPCSVAGTRPRAGSGTSIVRATDGCTLSAGLELSRSSLVAVRAETPRASHSAADPNRFRPQAGHPG